MSKDALERVAVQLKLRKHLRGAQTLDDVRVSVVRKSVLENVVVYDLADR